MDSLAIQGGNPPNPASDSDRTLTRLPLSYRVYKRYARYNRQLAYRRANRQTLTKPPQCSEKSFRQPIMEEFRATTGFAVTLAAELEIRRQTG
jgi:hypothetical protein